MGTAALSVVPSFLPSNSLLFSFSIRHTQLLVRMPLIYIGVTIPLAMLVAVIFYYIIMPSYGYTSEEIFALNASANASCH